jgi:hypothetical protein
LRLCIAQRGSVRSAFGGLISQIDGAWGHGAIRFWILY